MDKRLIDANKLKADIYDRLGGPCTMYGLLREIIDVAPTEAPARQARWELCDNGLYKCTGEGCNQTANRYQRLMWDFCPKCGAKIWRDTDGKG